MSDDLDSGAAPEELSPKEKAFLAQVHQRKVIADALQSGKLSCLPGADGYADTVPAYNLTGGHRYHGATLLQLKEFQKEHGFPTGEYVTYEAAQKAGVPVRKGEQGVTVSWSEQNNESGEWEPRTARLFNAAQTVKPDELRAWAQGEKEAYLKSRYGDQYQAAEQKEKTPGPDIVCSSTKPEQYLGQYLAAVSMGSKFKVSPEQASEFGKNFEEALFKKMENGHSNPFVLSRICNAASEHCKEVIKEIRKEQRMEQSRERKAGRSL